MNVGRYLIRHSEAAVIRCWPPDVRNKRHVKEVHEIQPAIEDKPPTLPMIRDEVCVALASEDPAVDEEEDEDYDDTKENAVPQFAVHAGFDGLFPRDEVLGRCVERVEGPDIKGC